MSFVDPRTGPVRLLQVTTLALAQEAFLLPFAAHFRAAGWRVDGLCRGGPASPKCAAAFDQMWDAPWSRNPLALHEVRQAARDLRALVERERYDLVHVHTPVAAFVTRYALRHRHRTGGPRVIYTAHGFHFHPGGSAFRNGVFAALERVAGRWTDYLVVINREDEAAARRYGIVPPERVRYMPGIGVDREAWAPERIDPDRVCAVRNALGVGPEEALLLMVAEFSPGKRHADALKAFAALGRTDAHLAFAGSGPRLEPMRALAARLGLEGRVHFLGFREDVPVLIRAARATVLPSEREGLPRSTMESLCLEVPVIGTDIRGLGELVRGGGGLPVRVGDLDGLARAMAYVLDHPQEAARMGRAGRAHMQAYELKHVLALHEALYAEALGEEKRMEGEAQIRGAFWAAPFPGGQGGSWIGEKLHQALPSTIYLLPFPGAVGRIGPLSDQRKQRKTTMMRPGVLLLLLSVTVVGCQSNPGRSETGTSATPPPGAGATLIQSEFVFERAPFASAHASTIAETQNGLVAAWFGGTEEGADDVGIWVARYVEGAWTPPVEVATGAVEEGVRYPSWNPVLFAPDDETLTLFYKVGPDPESWWGMVRTSSDGGLTWSDARRLPEGVLGPIKNKPVRLADGSILSPSSTETPEHPSAWRVHFERSNDDGRTWTVVRPAAGGDSIDAIQPSILIHSAQRLQAVGRTRSGRVFETWSEDAGRTWSPLALTVLPNPSAGTDALTLRDGRHLIVYNPTTRGRSPLSVAVSPDGKTWEEVLVLESEPGEYSYPAVIQTSDGLVHITYTWKRERIKHVVVELE